MDDPGPSTRDTAATGEAGGRPDPAERVGARPRRDPGSARPRGRPAPARDAPPDRATPPPAGPEGLTAAEAAARRAAGFGNPAPPPTTRTYPEIVRENVFTFINNVIFVLGLALVIVGRPLDALVSLVVISTNIVVSVVQEIRAKRTLDRIALLTRPTATVVRDGSDCQAGPEELVHGDLVRVGAGDQVVLDGRLVDGRLDADESLLTGESDLVTKRPGDPVYSGSFVVNGGGRFVVTAIGSASLATRITAGARSFRRVLTPLQSEIYLVIRVALGIVIYLEVVLLLNSVLKPANLGQAVGEATLVVGLVPNGLFVSIAIAYALGAIRIIRFGALVQQANAIESLSNVDVLCLDKTGTLTANRMVVEDVVPLDGRPAPELRSLLGDAMASVSVRNKTSDAIAEACPGTARRLAAEVAFSSARKWSACAFEPDGGGPDDGGPDGGGGPRGILALGAAEFLRPFLAAGEAGEPHGWASVQAGIAEHAGAGRRVVLVAGREDPTGITGEGDAAMLPAALRPIGLVVLRDELRPEARETIARFLAAGVQPKVISGDDPTTVAALARQVGLGPDIVLRSGPELEELDDAALAAAVSNATVFGRVTPALKERIVAALRRDGHYVAMIGDGVNDVLSLKKAHLGIAMQSGSQATRGVADIILTNDSFAALAPAVEEGQRILNGMQDILKLFLTRIVTLGLLIITSLVIGLFPIDLRNGSALTLFTVGVPSALLAVWAQPGLRHRQSLARTLARFVVPAAVLSSLVGLVVLYGTMLHDLGGGPLEPVLTRPVGEAEFQAALRIGQTAVTSFLVLAGISLLLFVEPPVEWLAVIEPRTHDRRPAMLALVLAVAYLLVLVVPTGQLVFSFQPLGPVELGIVGVATVGWVLLLRFTWQHRIVDRFLGF